MRKSLTAPRRRPSTAPAESDPSFLLTRWQDSVVTLWTPTTRASGFVVDARGLVVTSQRAIGAATRVEVQLTPAVKVAARVLVADPARDVAVLWIDREVVAAVRPVPLGCELAARPAVANGQEIFTIGAPIRGQKDLTSGTVSRVAPQSIAADFEFEPGGAGGPVFAAGGGVIGITSIVDDKNESRRDDTPRRPHRRGVRRRRLRRDEDAGCARRRTARACRWSRCGRFPWTRSGTPPGAARASRIPTSCRRPISTLP